MLIEVIKIDGQILSINIDSIDVIRSDDNSKAIITLFKDFNKRSISEFYPSLTIKESYDDFTKRLKDSGHLIKIG